MKEPKVTRQTSPPQKRVKRATAGYLERSALYYLERYCTSVAHFQKHMHRKVVASAEEHGTDIVEGQSLVESLTKGFVELGLLNDRRYASQRASSLHRKGKALRVIQMDLRQRGLTEDDINHALQAVVEETSCENADLRAAVIFARKKRLGPYQTREAQDSARDHRRALTAFVRNGFELDLAEYVLKASSIESLKIEAGL